MTFRPLLLVCVAIIIGIGIGLAIAGVTGWPSIVTGQPRVSSLESPKVSPSPTPATQPAATVVAQAASRLSTSTVAIRAFNQGKLQRTGSGVILTADGIVVTVAWVVPDPRWVYQVALPNNELVYATVLKRDFDHNLAFLQVRDQNFSVGPMHESDLIPDGTALAIIGRLVTENQPSLFVQPALVHHTSPRGAVISTEWNAFLNGASLADASGELIGLVYRQGDLDYLVSPTIIQQRLQVLLESFKG